MTMNLGEVSIFCGFTVGLSDVCQIPGCFRQSGDKADRRTTVNRTGDSISASSDMVFTWFRVMSHED
jgi:hypothetical protein